jgi:hypothetical protein
MRDTKERGYKIIPNHTLDMVRNPKLSVLASL